MCEESRFQEGGAVCSAACRQGRDAHSVGNTELTRERGNSSLKGGPRSKLEVAEGQCRCKNKQLFPTRLRESPGKGSSAGGRGIKGVFSKRGDKGCLTYTRLID